MDIRHPSTNEIPTIRTLWSEIFGDSQRYIELVFSRLFTPSRTLAAFDSGTLAAMAFFPRYTLRLHGRDYAAGYICGAATCPFYRGRGLMTELLSSAESEMRKAGDDYAFLIPASDSLVRFYAARGFRSFFTGRCFDLDLRGFKPESDMDRLYALYCTARKNSNTAVLDRDRFEYSLGDLVADGAQVLCDGRTAAVCAGDGKIFALWGEGERTARPAAGHGMLRAINGEDPGDVPGAFLELMLD